MYSYGDESGVSAKNIKDKLNDKTQLAELAYLIFDQLVDCRDMMMSLKSKCIDSKSIISKLTSIEKNVKESPSKIIEAQKHEIQQGFKNQSEKLQKSMQTDIKSYSDALQKDIKTSHKVIDIKKIETVVKKSITDTHAHRDRASNVMIFGLEYDPMCNDRDKVEKMMSDIDIDTAVKLVNIARIGRVPTTADIDRRPIKATLCDPRSAMTFLRAAPKLLVECYDHVYLSRDMTIKERSEHRVLVKKLKEAIKSRPSRYWIIKSGKLVDAGERRVESDEIVKIKTIPIIENASESEDEPSTSKYLLRPRI